jgi:aspartate kinase
MRSVEYARAHRVRLHVRSAFTWQEGTWVEEEVPDMEQAIVSAVTHDLSEAKMTIAGVPDRPGVAARVFRALADLEVSVDMIVQNTSDHGVTDISFTVPHDELDRCLALVGELVAELGAAGVSSDTGIARVSVVGAGMRTNPGVAASMFETLSDLGINIQMISTSAIRVSCMVDADRVEEAVQALHGSFGLAEV